MNEEGVLTQSGEVLIDKCPRCAGIWFDNDEADKLKDEWVSVTVDSGNEEIGKIYNEIKDIACPRCFKPMQSVKDPKQPHIEYEVCKEHGIFMDAGEFRDYKELTLKEAFDHILDIYRSKQTSSKKQ